MKLVRSLPVFSRYFVHVLDLRYLTPNLRFVLLKKSEIVAKWRREDVKTNRGGRKSNQEKFRQMSLSYQTEIPEYVSSDE